ncbi:probable multidrug resistance-associated protein lethal(2)03659 [Plutella xylostella]|uniref:ABC transporter family C protein ABCC2 n=1 Tax=Plutella xylostella TaxID=51655 RepID=A0A097DCY9_PLUXY|nr:probable multidrug resistance-associated protein lethal(2)03659 [Plutella xylostella]AIS93186.1 ABC transporter family C protein ABCC2 [Plutella xylostella]
MENGSGARKESEEKKEVKKGKPNVLSRLFMCWVCPVLVGGNRRDVEERDLIPPPSAKYKSESLGDKFERYWLEELGLATQRGVAPSLWRALRRAFWLSYMPGALLLLGNAIPRTIQPLLFTRLLSYWSADSTMTRLEAGYWAMGMLLCNFLAMVCHHHNTLFVGRFGMKVRIACCSLLYRKLLRLNQRSLQSTAAGKLVNLMSNDVARFDYAFMFLHYFWMIPLQSAAVLYFMFRAAGWAPIVGLFSVMLLILPIQAGLTKLTAVYRRETAQRTDKRIKLMSEIINGIQVIKMYAWEVPFQKVVGSSRAHEVEALKRASFVQGTFGGFMLFTERTSLFLTVMTLVLTGSMATATTVYPIQQYFSIIQSNLALILPIAIAQLTEMLVSLERLQEFLMLDEREDLSVMPGGQADSAPVAFKYTKETTAPAYIVSKRYSKKEDDTGLAAELVERKSTSEFAVELNDVSASWGGEGDKDQHTLRGVTLRVRRGKLAAIIGPVGSGKSSLLQVLLKEFPVSSGTVGVHGQISYACQESWLFSATVRDNILFGLPYDSKKYKKVCDACCLQPDFKQFPYGDLSLVGERGVSLSGGQRARINLARAVYRDADIYIFDDPLSAVDANVGRQLFEGCINGYLRGRTRVLVTHQIHFLKAADYIVILNEGAIENMGTYDDLTKLENSLLLPKQQEGSGDDSKDELAIPNAAKKPIMERGVSVISVKSEDNGEARKEQVQAAEERASGNLKWEVFARYLVSVDSWAIVALTLTAMLITQGAASSTDYWLSFWTNQVDGYIQDLPDGEEPDPSLGTQTGILLTGQYVYIYGALVLTIIVMSFMRLFGFVTMTMRAAANIHDLMFRNLIRATMRFFDTNPSGRVLNRFSKDMGGMDELLPRSILQAFQMYLSMASVLTLNAVSLPWTLIPTVLLLGLFIRYLKWYLNAAQSVKRLEGTTKSPVFGMIGSTLSGMSTIRSSDSQDRLIKNFDDCQNLHTSAFHTYIGGATAFGFYLDMICLVYLASILSIFILIDFADVIPVGSVGLAVSQSMVLTVLLQLAARFTSDFLAQMTAVERVLEYTKLPHEENINDGPTQPPKTWPAEGNIKFENVFLTYSLEDPPVLKNINFEIQSGWKVGVVGRTGAGKSSLISALFRLTNLDGSIKIDGIDTIGIAKQELRAKISIIPQEPVLFSATLRYNLDPFDLYSDDDIWRALEQVELKDVVPALDYKVSEGGSNFSVGQRQLLCLARAVLRSNKILVMDEATAHVDPQTDALIQSTIRRQFAACTVLTIAHRLNTVMDSDRVLVMDKGEVVEFDHPYTLLSAAGSHLNFMVEETGDNMSKALYDMAKKKYFDDHPQ